jgi:broad specificity phosphatase PhoE
MTTVYLIRHSIKEKNYGVLENKDSEQIQNEKVILSSEGEERALLFAKNCELQDIDEVWASNYVRAIQTAKYICDNNNKKLNISSAFDERHYGLVNENDDIGLFWVNQFVDESLKKEKGESRVDVANRMKIKIDDIVERNKDKKVAIVCHNACILFYILQYCKLEKINGIKRLTISYNDKVLIEDGIMKSPSMMKLEFDGKQLVNISYME